ncbi:FERM domain-containing protein 4B isoform X3 [Denticeps clupeoides]|nr:FERM domain-containing protein 4B-like isoform X3 [Denticeps clupeoides]
MALGMMVCGVEDLLASSSQFVWSLAERLVRKCYTRGLEPCRRLLQTWFRLGTLYQVHQYRPERMTEGRLCQVLLLDDRRLELLVQPKLLARDLLDLVSSHFNLKEKEYFGICFIDESGQCNWLHLERRVLDHDFPKKTGPLELMFLVRFYIESVTFLKETRTVELFYLNAKSSVFNGLVEVESEAAFKLAALALQEAKGEYTSDECTRSDLKKLQTLPTKVLQEHPSLAYCEEQIIEHYKKLKGLTRGQAIVQYLALVESLPTYGVHYFEVKDKQGIPWWLGVSYKGIGQCDLQDKLKPRKLFQWKQLENLYFREKKFAVEVIDPHRRVVTKRTFGQAGLVIHTWYASHTLIKAIWVMAISQHQFYLDRKQSKAKLTTARSLSDIAMDLTDIGAPRISKPASMVVKDDFIMASNGSLVSTGSADCEMIEEQKKEKIADLRKKEKDLNDSLAQRLEELKKICLREAELTGMLPKEYPILPGEKPPTIRKRVFTSFKLDDMFPYDKDPQLRNLESMFALQKKIVEAAKKLANEPDLSKIVKKKRRKNCDDAMRKLQEIENDINEYRIRTGKAPTNRASVIIDEANSSDLSSFSDSLTLDGDSLASQRQRSRSVQYSPRPSAFESQGAPYNDRRGSANTQLPDSNRLNYGEVHYDQLDGLSVLSSPSRPPTRDSRSMPPTPLLTRNAHSSTHLRYEDSPQHFRQRSGSLESQSGVFIAATDASKPVFSIPAPRRSTSTEILDDVSSYTSQSSVECPVPGQHCNPVSRVRRKQVRKCSVYANTGSMPNLAQHDECYSQAYLNQARPSTTAYYVTGYPHYPEPEPYSNGAYVYENDMEGHYNVNPTAYHQTSHTHSPSEAYQDTYSDEVDSVSQYSHYATFRPSRNRQPSHQESMTKNFHKAMVAEHLRGWYNRNTMHKQASYDYHSMAYQTMGAPYGSSQRLASYSSVPSATNSGNWHGHMAPGYGQYDKPMALSSQHAYSYSTSHLSQPAYSRYPPEYLCPSYSRQWRFPGALDGTEQETYSASARHGAKMDRTLM